MSKLPIFPILLFCLWQMSCFEPTEGCLDIRATNYQVDADDPCGDCCTFPRLTLQVQHQVDLPSDTTLNFKYETFYPSSVDPTDSFVVDRARFFISNLKLVREDGEEVGVLDTMEIEAPTGTELTIEDSFAKLGRDIFQDRVLGTLITDGTFTAVKMTLGLEEFLLQTDPASVPTGHPLDITGDTLNYDAATGYLPYLLIFRNDTTTVSDSLEIRIFEPEEISVPLANPFELDQGFDITLTLKVNYMAWFEGVDFQNDALETIRSKVRDNLKNAISVTEIAR